MVKPTPQPIAASREEVEVLLARIGVLYRMRTQAGVDYGAKLADLKKAYEEEVAEYDHEIVEAETKVRGWCAVNRGAICKSGQKTARFPTGTVKWRAGRVRVIIADAEKVLAEIKRLGLTRFIREKEEINQQALLAEPKIAETIPGVSIERAPEEIIVEPVKSA